MRCPAIRSVLCAALATLLSAPAVAQHPEGEPSALVKRAFANAKNVAGVFEADEPAGQVRHIQSGLTCPAYLGNAFLNQIMVFETPAGLGADIGCDYARRTAPGSTQAAAKHSVFAVKLPADWTLDTAFSYYQKEMHQSSPAGARSGGESLHFTTRPDGFPDVRSEELFYDKDGKPWQTEVIVAVVNGWIIEVRSTRASQYAISSLEEANDQPGGAMLFFRAVGDLGGPRIEPSFNLQPTDAPLRTPG